MSGGRLPKYRKHTTSDRAFVEYEGKRIYLPGAYNSPESKDAYGAFIREKCGGIVPAMQPESAETVAVIIESFLAAAELRHPGKRGTYQNLEQAVLPLTLKYGGLAPHEFGPRKLKEWQAILAGRKLSRDYVNDCCRRIKQMFKWAVGEEMVHASVHHALTAVPALKRGQSEAVDLPPRRMVAWENVEAVLPHISRTIRAMVELQWIVGARSQSLCLAKAEQFRLDVLPWEWRPRHKQEHTGAELVLYIGPKARAIFAPYLVHPTPPHDYLFQPRVARQNRRYSSFYSSQSYRQAIVRGIERANVEREKGGLPPLADWTPHLVRHARATLVREVHGLEAAQAVTGHESIEAVQIYAERRAKDAKRIAELDG